ncbi:MAG: hypothetical protein IKC63_08325 [Clostridia bacterium]|nr:hypothetical protein [Clostridia bacterium]
MKIRLLALLLVTLTLVSCGAAVTTTSSETTQAPSTNVPGTNAPVTNTPETSEGKTSSDTPVLDKSAKALLEELQPSIGEGLTTVIDTLNLKDRDTFSYHFFIQPTASVKEAAICQPMIGTIPFFLGILKTSSAADAVSLADTVEENVDPRKLVCATYEHYTAYAIGDTVILVMDGDKARFEAVCRAVEDLAGKR